MRGFKVLGGAMALLIGTAAHADVFPPQNPQGPRGAYEQVNYPYPGQCQADTNPLTTPIQWGVAGCSTTTAPSFTCPAGAAAGVSNFTAGGWRACGSVQGYKLLNTNAVDPAEKFVQPFLNPFDYIPDTTKFNGADFYDLGLHEAWGYQQVANTGLVPNPVPLGRPAIPNGMQWTGLLCVPTAPALECTCPAELDAGFQAAYCNGAGGGIPAGAPIYTPIWGIGQRNSAGPVIGSVLGVSTVVAPWSNNGYVATWPSVSIRAEKGRPVVVRWTNEFPNNHTFCAHPEAADWPCAIDRTFMGVKATIDPAITPGGTAGTGGGFGYNAFQNTHSVASPFKINQYGGAQQPDNSWVTHLHGGDIPPATDGFAEKWYGNSTTGPVYSPTKWFLTPAFESPLDGALFRPGSAGTGTLPAQAWNADTYTYPMDQEEALIWFHDHTLGKTHHNVIAGPAGFFPVRDPAKHGAINAAGACAPVAPATDCEFTWLDPITQPRTVFVPGAVEWPTYDFFMAIQDRAFNEDGSINFSNGLGNPVAAGAPQEITPVTPGDNALVHPVWLPEYFGDHVLVNGILWPKADVAKGWYRIRMANGSDSRCYTLGFSTIQPASGARPVNNVPFSVIADDQSYVRVPRAMSTTPVTFCPGERLELLLNFSSFATGAGVYMTNSAGAPFPAGETPFQIGTPWPDVNVIMKFAVTANAGVPTCGAGGLVSYDPANPVTTGCIVAPNGVTVRNSDPVLDPANTTGDTVAYRTLVGADGRVAAGTMCTSAADVRFGKRCVSAVRQLYLNERVDGTTGAPLGMQINGVPFEYKVTETPKRGSIEVWEIINLTVDAHPMHPHLVKHLRVGRQKLDVGKYKTALCGSSTCQAGPSPGNEMPVIPDVRNLFAPASGISALVGGFLAESPTSVMSGWKDASQIQPGETLVIIAKWDGHYHSVRPTQIAGNAGLATTPGSAAGPLDLATCTGTNCGTASTWLYEPVTSGPFVWHCHINSHEDSEMMRTSLVIE